MNRVKIGWAKRVISIDDNLCLFGQMYLRISQGILDPNTTTALVVDGGDGHVIFCSCDLEAHRGDSISETIARVTALRPEISPESIIMNCTHTHTGGSICETPDKSPDGVPLYSGLKYREFVISQCVEAIVEAWDNRKEGAVAYGYGYAVISNSRRVIYSVDTSIGSSNRGVAPNGHGVMYGNTAKDTFSHYEAGADHFLNLMYTFDAEGKLNGVLINLPCPSQLSESFLVQSADFWCEVRQLVKETYGENVEVLAQCAAAGDLSPRVMHYKDAQFRRLHLKYGLEKTGDKETDKFNRIMAERKEIALRIMDTVNEVYSWASKDIRTELPVSCVKKSIPISRRLITDEEKTWCEETIRQVEAQIPDPATVSDEEYRHAVTYSNSIRNRNMTALRRYEDQKTVKTLNCDIFVARIGEIAFTSSPYETFMDYMHRVQARSPFLQTFFIQLSGGPGATYLATERAMANKGYSASIFCNHISAEGGQEMVEAMLQTLNELNEK